VNLGNGMSLDMVLIPAGKFMMGSTPTEVGRNSDETQHEVTITKPFYIGKYEVTNELWRNITGMNPPGPIRPNRVPTTDISWKASQEFIEELNKKTSGGYRLPTEAEWEYACRAGTTTAFSFGSTFDKNLSNGDTNIPRQVGSYKSNAFGLYDMHGNVWEWCNDLYGPYSIGAVEDPAGALNGTNRVLRGSSCQHDKNLLRSASRNNLFFEATPEMLYYTGFRLVRTVDAKAVIAPTVPSPNLTVIPTTGNLLVSPFTEAKAKEVQKEVAKSFQKEVEEKVNLGNGVSLDMVLIPAGKFMMGSRMQELERQQNENQHLVTITKPFFLSKFEVSQDQWQIVMGNNPSFLKNPKHPCSNVSWEDCQEFIKKLNASTKGGYRLPTEAEWEFACKSGTNTDYYFGENLIMSDANYLATTVGTLKPLGSYKPNAFGLYDMHGNVAEFCNDWLADYSNQPVIDPQGPSSGLNRVIRGGSFNYPMYNVRSSRRYSVLPTFKNYDIGFRLAKAI
jgi:formylglycine-generating enzyme required for sulfatase activity